MARKKNDPVTRPAHYTFGTIEPLDAIEDWNLDMHEGNALMYIVRGPYKGSRVQDLKKAIFMLERKVALLQKRGKR